MSSKANPLYDMAPPPVELPNAMPVQQRQPQPNQMAPAAGTGKTGQVANIAANFLHGMLAAKDVKEQKMQETARFSISSAWNTYQQLQATASDPTATPEARKLATDNLGKAYNVYMDNVTRYTNPGDKSKKKGAAGVLSRVGGALTAQKPTLGTEDYIQLMKSPQIVQMMSMPHGAPPNPEEAQFEQKKKQAESLGLKPGTGEYNDYVAGRNITPPKQAPEKPEVRVMGNRTVERQPDGSWKDVGAAPAPANTPVHTVEMGNSTYEKNASGVWTRIGPAKKSSEGEGTWSLDENRDGKPILFNSKTGQTKDAPPGLLPKGYTAKQLAERDKFVAPFHAAIDTAADAKSYAEGSVFSGAGDDALMNQFQQVLQAGEKGTGIRFTKNEQDMLNKARSWSEGFWAKTNHVLGGTYYSPEQRKQIADTMQTIANRAQKQIDDYDAAHRAALDKMAPTPGAASGANKMSPPPPGLNPLDDELNKVLDQFSKNPPPAAAGH